MHPLQQTSMMNNDVSSTTKQRIKQQADCQNQKAHSLNDLSCSIDDCSVCRIWGSKAQTPYDKASIFGFRSPRSENRGKRNSQQNPSRKRQVTRRHAKLTLFLLLLNTLQSVIGRDATRAFTRDTTFFKLSHCNVHLILL